MTHQIQMPNGWVGPWKNLDPGIEPVFFFDGGFRTWGQVEQRAQLNKAIATHIAKHWVR